MPADDLKAFVQAVPRARDAGELALLLKEHVDDPHQPWGLEGRDARDVAAVLWKAREACVRQGLRSFLFVGTRFGYLFFALNEFFKVACKDIFGTTIDVRNYIITDVLDFIRTHRMIGHWSYLAHHTYDMVFVDARAGHRDVVQRFIGSEARTKVCVAFDATGTEWWQDVKEHAGAGCVFEECGAHGLIMVER